ncbi:hypothetical protein ACFXD5_19660 [Streptomyces sp. NPDC059385]|uniref:hypothetical protein n=1 Tax=Streptomyces sp. NPDC059385 TaxID=3346817 RepID=UPI0036D1796A
MRMPRPIADVIAFWRDIVRHPREVLLVRGHHQWMGAAYIAAVHLPWVIDGTTPPHWMQPLLILFYLNFALDLAGWILHVKWSSEELWQSVECPICDAVDEDEEQDTPAATKV